MKRTGRTLLFARLATLTLMLGLFACSNVTYRAPLKTPSHVQVEHDLSFFLFGIVGEEHVWVDRDCGPAGAAKLNSRQTVVDTLLTLVTIGIYAPRTVTVTCAAEEGAI